ncbi:MAG: hypothetical protein ACYS74_02630 [Planctomycetota bacterium]|jgi:hypothetical protein
MSKDKIHTLLKSFSQRPIAYQKIYAQITGSVTAGLLLSQVVYWWFVCGEREFYKTDNEFRDELGMGPREFKTAKSQLKKLGLVRTTVKGIPARTYYVFDETELLARIYSWAETHRLVESKSTKRKGQNAPTITKTNARDHAENTNKQEKEVSSQGILALDPKITQANKLFMEQISTILRPRGNEGRTFANIAKHLIDECQAGKLPVSIFADAIEWAKQAKASTAENKKGLFVAKIKQETGFKAQRKLLAGNAACSSHPGR